MENKLNKILDWLEDYKTHTNCKGVVLGISGGKDSTIVAMLAKKVWGDNVIGILMPNKQQNDIYDSINIVEKLGLKFAVINIGNICSTLTQTIEDISSISGNLPFKINVTDKSKTNIPPRIRMTALYAIAQSLGYRVIGTGNKSEAYIGWTTKWGDSAYDLNPIYHLTCSEVIELGKLLAKDFKLDEKYIVKNPADGLTGKSDEENFGFSYTTLDSYINGNPCLKIDDETADKIRDMHVASMHKRNMPLTID